MSEKLVTTELCPSCRRQLRAPQAFAGQLVQCRFCHSEFWLAKRIRGSFRAECPGCRKNLRVPRRYAGCHVECNCCGTAFVAPVPHRVCHISDHSRDAGTSTNGGGSTIILRSKAELPEDHVVL